MEEREVRSPAGTVVVSRTEWLDEASGRLLNQHERAVAFVRDYWGRLGEWPSIKSVVVQAGVGTGTAWRALRRVREERGGE
jgi:hypothetical protein